MSVRALAAAAEGPGFKTVFFKSFLYSTSRGWVPGSLQS